jgi:hypothetical protein
LTQRFALPGRGSRNANLQRAEGENREVMIAGERLDFGVVTIILPCTDNLPPGRADVETLVRYPPAARSGQFNGVSALGEEEV